MFKWLLVVCAGVCLAVGEQPAAPSEFTPPVIPIPQLVAQEQMFRRMADVYLGLQISSSFLAMGQTEFQKGQIILSKLPSADGSANLPDALDTIRHHISGGDPYVTPGTPPRRSYTRSHIVTHHDEPVSSHHSRHTPKVPPRASRKVYPNPNANVVGEVPVAVPVAVPVIMPGVVVPEVLPEAWDESDSELGPDGENDVDFNNEESSAGADDGEDEGRNDGDDDGDDDSFLQLKQEEEEEHLSLGDLEHTASYHKMAALKAMHIQFYLAASDVQRSYWVNRIVALVLPPQLAVFKLYKSYLNTMALSVAFQFHDAFTCEAYLDDFNDRWGAHAGASAQLSEALAEQNTYSQWSTLVSLKYQLLLISLYEKSIYAQFAAAQPAAAPVALLELDSGAQFVSPGGAGAFGAYPYLQMMQVYVRWMAIASELQLAQAGLYVSHVKVAVASGKSQVDVGVVRQALGVESAGLPSLFMQWASLSQQKYYLDMYSFMFEMYAPPLAAAVSADRAENTFQTLVQTDVPVADADPVAARE